MGNLGNRVTDPKGARIIRKRYQTHGKLPRLSTNSVLNLIRIDSNKIENKSQGGVAAPSTGGD